MDDVATQLGKLITLQQQTDKKLDELIDAVNATDTTVQASHVLQTMEKVLEALKNK